MRPIDLQALLNPEGAAGEGAGGEEDGEREGGEEGGDGEGEGAGEQAASQESIKPEATLAECILQLPSSELAPAVGPSWEAFVQANGHLPLRQFVPNPVPLSNVRPDCLL
jgi:hypothetical protein